MDMIGLLLVAASKDPVERPVHKPLSSIRADSKRNVFSRLLISQMEEQWQRVKEIEVLQPEIVDVVLFNDELTCQETNEEEMKIIFQAFRLGMPARTAE
jgi:hypothetical protein